MQIVKNIFLIAMAFFALAACEKEIELDLVEAAPQLVIEAPLKVGTNPFTVTITKTASFFEAGLLEVVENATIFLRDDMGNSIEIPYTNNGKYVAEITGVAGTIYTLNVEVDGQIYEASSFLPTKVELVDIEYKFEKGGIIDDDGYEVFVRYNDPLGVQNYYRVVHTLNDTLQNNSGDLQVMNDDFNDGTLAKFPVLADIFNEGDRLAIELIHFDRNSYDYFKSVVDIVGENQGLGGATAAPGNPNTNWSGGALGYFSAYNSDTKSIQILE